MRPTCGQAALEDRTSFMLRGTMWPGTVGRLEELTMVPTKASQETGPLVTKPWELDSTRTQSPRHPDCSLGRP